SKTSEILKLEVLAQRAVAKVGDQLTDNSSFLMHSASFSDPLAQRALATID
ncbi:hypothetical protein A2U01_0118747, partial [Trifolium medium]|nr:hypothetical protein [Trifolium medium]